MISERGRKGVLGAAKRASLLPLRYGVGVERVRRRLRTMLADLHRREIAPTIPVTGSLLDHHPGLLSGLEEVDFAIHGYMHVAYADLSPEEQAADLDAARRAFASQGVPVRGFRAPYLRANGATRELIRSRGFLFDSSVPAWGLPPGHPLAAPAAALVRARYGDIRKPPLFPGADGAVVEIPVSLPDDEILVDGLGLHRSGALEATLSAMLEHTRVAGSVLVLQMHPERYHLVREALDRTLERARDEGAWFATLASVAEEVRGSGAGSPWPRGAPFAVCVTGDLDAVTLGDFALRLRGP